MYFRTPWSLHKSHGLIFERLLCENSDAELNCPVGNAINDINITFHDVQDTCSLTDDVYQGTMALNSTYYPSCIGHNSCVLKDTMINISHSVADRTKKIFIKYNCVRTSDQNYNPKNPKTVCPFNMESVACGSTRRKIEIQSVELLHYLSFCDKQYFDKNCTELVHQKVNTSCNGKQKCEPLIWNESIFTWDDCIRISKFVNISFSCKAIPSNIPLQDESNVVGVAVGVTVGLITIVGVIIVYIWFVRRQHSSRDQPNKNNKEIENEYIIPCPVTQKNKSKQTNKDQKVNYIKSSNGNGIREQTKSSLFISADYFIVLEPNGTDHPLQHPNSNIYEMANPLNENEMDK
ncbi:unnamed protein product [Mytilus coruscus]|uniref:SUEL-type lectin domain-containing protein n=1 Tax=Mytilus coruscus TaxID=42192 RepID=A0A6J8CBZ8_MYTCO|nr:unnamed protein product [Mytilus coruscus]